MSLSDAHALKRRVRRRLTALDVVADWTPRRRLFNSGPRVIANSVPKAGTNLLVKALQLSGGLRRSRFALHREVWIGVEERGPTMPVGVDRPVNAPVSDVRRRLRLVAPGSVISAHLPHSSQAEAMLDELSYRMIVVVRDPRDVVRSLVPYVMARPHHPLHDRFIAMDDGQRLMAAIVGVDGLLDGVRQRFERVVEWTRWVNASVLKFEDLVGPHGGGSEERQIQALLGMASHVGIPMDRMTAQRVGRDLFGGTSTFRRGATGTWREVFTDEHKTTMHEVADDLLTGLGYETDDTW